MVPGMTEREQLAAETRRREWLAESAIPQVRAAQVVTRRDAPAARLAYPLGIWRRVFASALLLSHRLRMASPGRIDSVQRAVDVSVR